VTGTGISTTRLSLIGFIGILVIAWLCYRPALDGDFQLDDRGNLSGLAAIEDRQTAIDFIIAGEAGPMGRPLALATFALQAEEWNKSARSFIAVNVAINLVNATILAAFLFQLSLLIGARRHQAAQIAALATGTWVLMPLVASATLLIIQRMTTLSATFVLLGLLGYVLARAKIDEAPRQSLFWMGLSLVLGTLFAVLSKESGALLPAYVLVIEATLLQAPKSIPLRRWRLLQGVFLGVPVLAILGYLAINSSYSEAAIAKRGFTGWERLLTESQLLWVYLKKAVIGLPSALGVYQTPPEVARSLFEPATLLSVIAWVSLVTVTVIYRHAWPLLGFAVAWFLAGHVLESTTLQLELYFEHRNYLPIVGPVFAGVAALVLALRQRWLSTAIVSLFLFVNALLLYQVASMSGNPSASSRYWAHEYPDSVRAVMTMATYQLAEEGPLQTLRTLDEFVLRQPQHSYLRIQELNLRCLAMPAADHGLVVEQLHRDLPAAEFTLTTGRMLSQLFDTLVARQCNGVDTQTLLDIADSVLANPRYAAVTDYRQFHYRLLAGVARQQGRHQEAIAYVQQAIAVKRSPELNMMMVTALGSSGEYEKAREYIGEALTRAPSNPIRAFRWRRDLHDLREYIDSLERYSTLEE
jgi:tetratricopeptide (TPR) repeat protein